MSMTQNRLLLALLTRVSRRSDATLVMFGRLIGLLALAGALFVAGGTPGTGAYEVSIYRAYPVPFWVLTVVTIGTGITIGLGEVFVGRRPYGWVHGFGLVVAANTLILSLPYLRDYAFISLWDPTNHFSFALNIIEHGRPAATDFYPVAHLIAAAFSRFTGVDLQIVILVFPVIFYLVYLANTAFVAWTIDERPAARGLILVLASPLVFYFYAGMFYPTHFAVYMVSFVAGWIFRVQSGKGQPNDRIPLLLLLPFLPLLHPWAVVSGATLIAAFGIACIYQRIHGFRLSLHRYDLKFFLLPLLVLSSVWAVWFTRFPVFGATLQRLISSLTRGAGGRASLTDYISAAQRGGLSTERISSLIVFTYGPGLIYCGLAMVVLTWTLSQVARRRSNVPVQTLALSFFVVVFAALATLSLFRDLVVESPLRLLNFAVVAVPLLTGGLFYDQASGSRSSSTRGIGRYIFRGSLLTAVVVASTLGIFHTYYSPLTGQPNYEMTHAHWAGLAFLVREAPADAKNIYTPLGTSFMLSAVLDADSLSQLRKSSPRWWIKAAPAHFAFGAPGESDIDFNPGYLLVSGYERAYYTEVWSVGGRFTPQDFSDLERDPAWNQIYTSGDFTIWRHNRP